MAADLNELRLQVEKLTYENKEAAILGDATREQNNDLSNELEELKKTIVELKAAQKSMNDEGKQRKKAEKMAQLMAGFESVSPPFLFFFRAVSSLLALQLFFSD
jgi:kinesin family protein 5